MKHLGARAASLIAAVFALACAGVATAQTTTSTTTSSTTAVTAVNTSTATAQPGQPKKRVRKKIVARASEDYRNPSGSTLIGFFFGIGYSSQTGTNVLFGLGLGHAIITGVLPGVRGVFVANSNGIAGEVAGTLTLTPPLSWAVTPFAIGEIGYHGEGRSEGEDQSGLFYGAGGGVYLGDPASRFGFQIGYVWRRIVLDSGKEDLSGPILAFTYRF